MDTETLRRALEEAGLTGQQADTYLTLLELGPSPVVEITQHSSVSSSRIYDIVRQLEEMGFAETIERDRLHARPREPIDVLERLRDKSEMLADAAGEIEDRWEQPDPQESRISVLKQQESVLRSASDAITDAVVSVELAVTPEQLRELQPTIETAAAENGVLIQVDVYDIDGTVVDEDIPRPEGVLEVRRNPIPGPFLAIVDRRHAYFSPNVHSDEPYGITIGDEILSFILHWYFLTCLWGASKSIYINSDHPPTYVSIEEFVHDAAPLWHEGATMTVTAIGHHNETDELVEVTGKLVEITSNGFLDASEQPTYTDLAGQVTLFLETDDGEYTVGGWGALFEDVEAQVIRIEDIELERP